MRLCLRTPMPTQTQRRAAFRGCGFACDLPCRPKQRKGGSMGRPRLCLRTSMPCQANERKRHWGGFGSTREPPCRPQSRLAWPPRKITRTNIEVYQFFCLLAQASRGSERLILEEHSRPFAYDEKEARACCAVLVLVSWGSVMCLGGRGVRRLFWHRD